MRGGRIADVIGEAILRKVEVEDCAISASRVVLATIEAAAIDSESASPPMMARAGQIRVLRHVAPVDERKMRAQVQRGDRAGHGAQGRAANIVGVDLRGAREDHGDAERPGEDDRPQCLALRLGQRLRIVEPFRQIVRDRE